MGKRQRKPRTAINRKVNKWLKGTGYGGYCDLFDGFGSDGKPICECFYPGEMRKRCTGNIFDCIKQRYKLLASVNEKERKRIINRHNF